MMNEEEYLNSKLGKGTPFSVPEGYFEQLAEQVMQRLPEKKAAKPAIIRQLRPWLYAAACVCVGAFVAAMFFNSRTDVGSERQMMASAEQESLNYYSDNYIDEEADYAMVDNQEIYACLLADM